MKGLIGKLKKKDGWVTLVIIFMLSIMLPIFLFFLVEMNYLYGVKDKAQFINDNISASAVRSLDEQNLNAGNVVINEANAISIANNVFKANYQLNDDLSINSDSLLRENPTIKTYVINPTVIGEEFTTDEGYTYTINHPTVIVYTSIKPKGVFFNKLVDIKSVSMHVIKGIPVTGNNSSNPNNPSAPEPVIMRYTIPEPDLTHIPDQGTFSGKATITVNGILYFDGRLLDGKFNKQGTLYDKDGKIIYSGSFTNGIYDGNGVVYNPDGSKFYEGAIVNGVPDGNGTYYGTDGIEDYKGQFINGYRQGFGNGNGNGNGKNNNSITAEMLLFEKIYLEEE